MADRRPVPLLTLDSLVDRPVVVIDNKEYLLITNQMLPPLDAHRVQRMSVRMDELLRKGTSEELSEEELAELDAMPLKMCKLILEAPDDVLNALSNRKRMEIIGTFVMAPMMTAGMLGRLGTTSPTDRSTGANSLPDSAGSTGTVQ